MKAFTKEVKGTATEAGAPKAVVKVTARAALPVRALLDTFLSEDEEEIRSWNPFAGETQHLDRSVQLQTYRLPWPFASREYLVRCEASRYSKSGHQATCTSIEDHPSAPPTRSDHVRGVSETVWRFVEERDGQTSIHLETHVDPRGALPSWVVDKLGKTTAIKIVRSLISHTSQRVQRVKAEVKDKLAKAGSGGGALSCDAHAAADTTAVNTFAWARGKLASWMSG